MPVSRVAVLRGPAKVTYRSASFFSAGDITIDLNLSTFNVGSSIHGEASDERADERSLAIKFTPIGEWEHMDILWPYRTHQIGASIFGASDNALVIKSVDGKTFTAHNAAVTSLADINLSAKTPLIGEIGFTALVKNNTAPTTADSLFTIGTSAWVDADQAAFDIDAVVTQPYAFAWGSSPWDAIQTESGARVSFELGTTPTTVDEVGLIDMTLSDLKVMAKFSPLNVTEAQIFAAMKLQDTGALVRGKTLRSAANDFVATGTGVVVTVHKAAMKTAGYRFGRTVLRNGEIGLVAVRGYTSGVLQPLYTLGTGA